jgi:NADH:ubiquinone reductase (non-electrogenic)
MSCIPLLEPIRNHLVGFSDAQYIQAECSAVNLKDQSVLCTKEGDKDMEGEGGGRSISVSYDQLVVAVGAEPATFNIPGVRERCMFIKEIDDGRALIC